MQKYCYIENGEVVQVYEDLPEVWKNVSNFYALPESILKTYGWLPLTIETENKPIFVSSSYIIKEDRVIEAIVTRDQTLEEIKEEQNKKLETEWYEIRTQRDRLLKQSDLLVLIDKWEILTEERKQEIRVYRQALRDIPQNFKNLQDIIWPNL